MFTRDISLEDCILDLIDNSIDGLVRTRKLDISSVILQENTMAATSKKANLLQIDISYSETHFEIKDNCGGIRRKDALEDVFNFGHAPGVTGGTLGVYGIGLKRAIFKLGEVFDMKSQTIEDGFAVVKLNVKDWAEKDDDLEDWKIPLVFTGGADSEKHAGTTIKITKLRPEVVMRIKDGVLEQKLRSVISRTYALFIGRYVSITLNGKEIVGFEIPLGKSNEVEPAYDIFEDDGVKIELFASLAIRKEQEWKAETAGWYVLCNGRVVVAADKTELTGWGAGSLPQFHSKFRGFIGVAFFRSKDPMSLPWTTSKRGLNQESRVYQNARNRMRGIARPIITFLDSVYKTEMPEDSAGRTIANAVKPVSLSQISLKPATVFAVHPASRSVPTKVSIQFSAEKANVETIRKHLKAYSWGANRIGEHTFNHFLKTECPE
jgi:hypothetical protein